VGWAGVMVFFGYVENYALASVILLFFFNYSIEYIHSGKKLTLVVGLFLLAFFMHNLIIFLLPSLMYILITRFKKNRNGSIWGMFVSIIPVFIWIVISYAEKEGSAFLLPNSSSEPGYLLWSGSHLLDILNELLLVSPVFIVLLFIQRIKYKKKKLHLRVFFWLSALASLVVLLFLDPKLGMARDWDLFAMPLLGFHMALFISADWQKAGKLVKSAVVVVSIAFSVIWVLLNSDEEHSIERYKNIINLESERRCYGYEVLGEYYRKQDNLVEAEQAYSLAIQSKPHYRCYLWLGYIQRQLDKDEQAEQNFMKVLELMPNQPNALDNLGRLYFKMGRWKEAWYYLNQYIQTPTGNIDRGAKVALKMLENKLAKDKERVDD
jgi:tetratricopeptide (TPR) repeat protein